jgi:hypothetical protein
MSRHRYSSCPIGQTCPDIDTVISLLSKAADRLEGDLEEFDVMDPVDVRAILADCIGDIRLVCDGKNSYMNMLRDSNSKLREWGERMEEERNDFEKEITQ